MGSPRSCGEVYGRARNQTEARKGNEIPCLGLKNSDQKPGDFYFFSEKVDEAVEAD